MGFFKNLFNFGAGQEPLKEEISLKANKISNIREWISQRKIDANSKISEGLLYSFIFILSKFCREDPLKIEIEDIIKQYRNDVTLFEYGCYLYFRIDFWLYKKNYYQTRKFLLPNLMMEFLKIFAEVLQVNIDSLNKILINRLALYGKIIRGEKNTHEENLYNKIEDYLVNLIYYTKNNILPIVYDFENKPPRRTLEQFDFYNDACMRIETRTFEQVWIPAIFNILQNIVKEYNLERN